MASSRQAVTTYRYLRVAMAVLPVGLAAAVIWEISQTGGHCVLDSISAYYYTPAQGVVVGVLMAIGVCLFVIKGESSIEDVLLNLAGMAAPVVALVPTPYPSPGETRCDSVEPASSVLEDRVTTNVVALLALGVVVVLVAALIRARTPTPASPLVFRIGRVLGLVLFVGAAVAFIVVRRQFLDYAHYTAAVLMFGAIIAIAVIKAVRRGRGSGRRRDYALNGYVVVAVGMLACIPLGLYAAFGLDWDHTAFAVEVALIVLFTGYWILETREHWSEALTG